MPLTFTQLCADYLSRLRAQRDNPHATAELSLRAALDDFLTRTAQLVGQTVEFVGEGRLTAAGRPDFIVTLGGVPIGYIEAEKLGADLDHLSGHAKAQNERFTRNLDNFLLTNHLEFRLYNGGVLVAKAALPELPAHGVPVVPEATAAKLLALFEQLMHAAPLPIKAPRDLAQHLSRRARQLRDTVREMFEHEEAAGELAEDYEAFKQVLLPDLRAFLGDEERSQPKRLQSFDDLYAQTVAYGLFAARCGHSGPGAFTRRIAADYLGANPFLKKLFGRFTGDLIPSLAWIVDDMAALLDTAPMGDIQQYFFKRTGREDPMIDFYEPFLRAYDAGLRDVRGVYYTPEPVVGYIVRSVDILLQRHFGLNDGLADTSKTTVLGADGHSQEIPRVLLLDPATGTGSFLFAAIDHIHEQVKKRGSAAWQGYARDHLLGRLFGFELLMAPYTIAHLKLGLQLEGKGTPLADKQRFGVYLTNTLDDAVKQSDLLMGRFISDEANAAVDIKKEKPILVVLGNPPYSGHSANSSRDARGQLNQIGRLIEAYKCVDGQPLGERNPKWLQDDYVKFIAFAQERIRKTGEGVVGYITNHGYLDNPTFRGMRQSLMQTFTDIYVLDLHGNAKKQERAPDGSADQNVFEIQQGVAILLCVKEKGKAGPACVHHAHLWGRQSDKYEVLSEADVSTTAWAELKPSSPFYFFVPQNTDLQPEYQAGIKVTEAFPVNVLGFQTHRDHFAIDFDAHVMRNRIAALRDTKLSDDEVRQAYGVADNRDWQVAQARARLRNDPNWESKLIQCAYRPFDNRVCYFSEVAMDYPRAELTRHMLHKANLAFNITRQTRAQTWQHAIVTDKAAPAVFVEIKDGSSIFPLYLYPAANSLETERRPNLSLPFLKTLAQKLNLPQAGEHGLPQGLTPEDIFHYAYAILHAPTYRERYAEFLKTDFPRLPLTGYLTLFRDLAELGRQLVALHLLDVKAAPQLDATRHPFEGVGDDRVERAKVKWQAATQRVTINATQGFEQVPEAVWEFRVGGYQVAEKWLKDRDGRTLTFDEQTHYGRVLVALAETMRLMDTIDERIPSWPL